MITRANIYLLVLAFAVLASFTLIAKPVHAMSCIDEKGAFIPECTEPPEVIIISVFASPTTIVAGESSTVSVSVNFSGNGTCNTNIPGSGTPNTMNPMYTDYVVYPTQTTSYFYTCTNYNGASGGDAATVTVVPATIDVYAGATSPSSATAGTPVSFSSTVANQGTGAATSFPNSFQISGVGYAGAETHTLGAGGSAAISGSYTFSSSGTYQVRACADTNTSGSGSLSESDETNNCGAWTAVTVAQPALPDLTAANGGAVSGTRNVALTLSGTISNVGTAAAAAHSSVFQICGNGTDASCTTVQANNQVATGALSASQSQAISTQFTFVTAGTNGYSYRVCADNWTPAIAESDDTNNCSGWAYITVNDPSIVASCSASPTTAAAGQNVTWTASASGGNGVYSYSWSGTSPLSGSGNPKTVSYSSSGAKTGSVSITSGTANTTVACSNSVTVSDPPSITVFTGTPGTVSTGNAATLTWSSTGATSCTGTGLNTGGATSGSVSTGALSSTQNYQISCTGAGGTTNAFTTVTVVTPTATMTAEPTFVKSGGTANLKWSATDVSSCTISANPTTGSTISQTLYSPVSSGTITTAVTNITKQSDFTVSCTTLAGGTVSASVQVNVRFGSGEF